MKARKPRSSRSGRPTMADVASAAGVSAMTVSRALNRPDTVTDTVRDRVTEACRALGYVPSRLASGLASARTRTVAVLIPSVTNSVFIDVLAGIHETFGAAGYQAMIGVTGYDAVREEDALRVHLAHHPDGVLMTGLNHSRGTWDLLAAADLPTVHTMDLDDEEIVAGDHVTVGFSQYDAGHAMGRHLLKRGRTRIAIAAAQLDPRTLRRCDGCRDALRDAGRYDPELDIAVPDASSPVLGADLLDRIVDRHPDCDALFLCNDDLAQGALFRCAQRGIAVPARLAVAGFNDLAGAAWTTPPLTTVATPRRAIGQTAARLVLALIDGREVAERRVDLGFRLLVRSST